MSKHPLSTCSGDTVQVRHTPSNEKRKYYKPGPFLRDLQGTLSVKDLRSPEKQTNKKFVFLGLIQSFPNV